MLTPSSLCNDSLVVLVHLNGPEYGRWTSIVHDGRLVEPIESSTCVSRYLSSEEEDAVLLANIPVDDDGLEPITSFF